MPDQIEPKDPPPVVEPGQIWLIEQVAAAASFACDRRALNQTDIILYDPALTATLPALLPSRAYAEPIVGSAALLPARALVLAADGWRVARLVAAGAERHAAPAALRSLGGKGDLPVRVIAKTRPDRRREWDARLGNLPGLVAELADEDLLTLVLGPLAARDAAWHCGVAANGLAG